MSMSVSKGTTHIKLSMMQCANPVCQQRLGHACSVCACRCMPASMLESRVCAAQAWIEKYFPTREMFAPLAAFLLRAAPEHEAELQAFARARFGAFTIGLQVMSRHLVLACPAVQSVCYPSYAVSPKPHAAVHVAHVPLWGWRTTSWDFSCAWCRCRYT
jgi:hypothetical protein